MNKLLIFAKSPIKGKVKTRLKKDTPLTDDDILKLYIAFLKDTIISASLSKAQRIYIAYYPEDSKEVMLLAKSEIRNPKSAIELFPQAGKDFDIRLTKALRNIHNRSSDNIIILGSDSPHIQPSTINKAFKFLSKKSPINPPFTEGGRGGIRGAMVLGPSGEGGIYLIGLRGDYFNFERVFTAGNESDNLLKIAKRRRLQLFILEELTDVDVKSDLITLISNLSMMKYSYSYTKLHLPKYTINAIKELGLKVNRKGDGTRKKYLSRNKP